ncbi:MAG: family 20 glycosylhydrolase, partial [Candidatus Acidiferrales bacterium]
RYDVYSQLAEVPHGSVLTPTQPGSYDLLGKMIAAMAPIFKGPFFHIGADETFELGRGQTKDLVAQKGLGQVYLDHIAKLDEMLKPYHKQTMFWADIAEHFPELLPTLPKDLIAVIWTYGNKDSYDERLAPFRNAGLQIFVSPGVTNWRHVYPDFNGAYLNIRNLTRDGQKFGALGMLNTEWKDWGEALGGMDWPGFVFGAACAWQPGESSIEEFRDSYDWAFYRNADHTFEDILNKLADTNSMLDGVKMNGTYTSYFWADPFSQAGTDYATTAAPVLHDMRVEAEQAWESLLENRGKARANADTIDDLIFAAHRLDVLGMKLEYTKEMSEDYWDAYMNMGDRRRVERNLQALSSMNGDLQDLREEMTGLRDDYAKRWRVENREYWLGNVTIRYDAMANAVQEKINEINVLEDNYSRLGELPTPESVGFFARPPSQQGGH